MLQPDFTFSQQNLQDYLDCPRRFYLRHVEHLAWPAVESEPVLEQERRMQLGHDFHMLVQQRLSGIPADALRDSIQGEELQRWWMHFEALDLDLDNQKSFVEEALSVPLAGYRLLAKPDLLLIDTNGRIQIYDWKTSRSEPDRSRLLKRAQSIVYPYVIARCSRELTGSDLADPADIRMTYWFPEHPALTVTFDYSPGRYSSDEQWLSGLINEIASLDGRDQYPKTDNIRMCKFCNYRSLCDRGDKAGSSEDDLQAASDDDIFKIDFESL